MRPDADDIPTLRITPCPACGHDVSIAAAGCPHCGHPRAGGSARPGWMPGRTVTTQATGKEAKALIAGGGVVLLLGLGAPDGWQRDVLLAGGGFGLLLGWLIQWWHCD